VSSAASPETAAPPLPTRQVVAVFVGLQIGMIISTLDGTIVATALPTIAGEVDAGDQRSWVITAYLLAQVAVMPLYGKLGDLYGRKRLFLVAISTFTGASMLCGLAADLPQLVAFRALQGIGAGGLGPLAMAVLADVVPTRQLGRWLGYQGALFAVASLLGPLAGGLFVDQLSWRWAFFINVPLAAVSVVMVVTALHVPYRRIPHSVDYPGAALLTVGIVGVVLAAAVTSDQVDWPAAAIGALVLLTAAALVAFSRWERRAREPVVPLALLRDRVVRVAVGMNFTTGALFASGIYFIPVFAQEVAGVSATRSGLLLVPFMFTTAACTLVAGRAVERTGTYRRWPILGGVVMTVGVLLLATAHRSTSVLLVSAFGAVVGVGVGFVMQTSLLALQNSIDHRDLGVATSSALLARVLGVTIGTAVWSAILQRGLAGAADATAHADALRTVYLAAAPVGLAALVLALRLEERPLRDHAQYGTELVELGP
jgi:EmrB/QacA subfamily drug resistance transporter